LERKIDFEICSFWGEELEENRNQDEFDEKQESDNHLMSVAQVV